MDRITGTIAGIGRISGELASGGRVDGSLTIPEAILPPSYSGPYTVTPSAEEQILQTEGKYMRGNITVDPVPSNYGLITWDGSTITVS